MIFTRDGKILWETAKWEKPKETRDTLCDEDKMERGQTELKRRKQKKKKSKREKDYGRLRSANENEKKVKKKKKNEKRRLN